jgi:septal ring factor EnvC (AmiA/AmiB activator)
MKKTDDAIEKMFDHFEDQWDIQELPQDHNERFLNKQKSRNRTKSTWYQLSIAASILLLVGLFFFLNKNKPTNDFKLASAETQRTDSVFNAMVQNELLQIKEKKSPLNEKIVNDALKQMQQMDADYEKIKKELVENGENKQIIYAMIHNFKTRIEFLENVLKQLENTEKLNTTNHEKTI